MNNTDKIILACCLLAGLVVGGLYVSLAPSKEVQVLKLGAQAIASLTQTSYAPTSTTPTLVSTGDKQGYRIFSWISGQTTYLFFSATSTGITSSTATAGIPLSSTFPRFEVKGNDGYLAGMAYAITSSGTSSISVGQ